MTEGTVILVVDDDPRVCRLLERYLLNSGLQVDIANDGDEMRRCIERRQPALVLLDLQLPGTSGLELLKELRIDSDVGIIILTGTGVDIDMIIGLEIGADDYVQKPFDHRELLARIRSVLRRRHTPAQEVPDHSTAKFAGWELDFTSHQLIASNGEEVDLTGREFQLLGLLVKSANKVFTRDQIMDEVSGRGCMPSDRSVDSLVVKLRKKVEADPKKPSLIRTIRGSGYILTSRVELI